MKDDERNFTDIYVQYIEKHTFFLVSQGIFQLLHYSSNLLQRSHFYAEDGT